MIRTNCFYYYSKITKYRTYPQCKNHVNGFCPCEECNEFISKDEMRRQIEIMKKVRKEAE